VAPCWGDPPHYRLNCPGDVNPSFAVAVDAALCQQNEEYASRRKSNRLGVLQIRTIADNAIPAMDQRLANARRGVSEQYKRPCLLTQPGEDENALTALASAAPHPN
jgi:hypothetical protein